MFERERTVQSNIFLKPAPSKMITFETSSWKRGEENFESDYFVMYIEGDEFQRKNKFDSCPLQAGCKQYYSQDG